MSNLPKLVVWPNPLLGQKSLEVTDFTNLVELEDWLQRGVREYDGLAIAAVQLGVHKRSIGIAVTVEDGKLIQASDGNVLIMHNPKIMVMPEDNGINDWAHVSEGCLSYPGITVRIRRSVSLSVMWQNSQQHYETAEARGLMSQCIQHEIDHLNGVTLYDHANSMQQSKIRKTAKKGFKVKTVLRPHQHDNGCGHGDS